jgi:biotin transport system substrate-specific component
LIGAYQRSLIEELLPSATTVHRFIIALAFAGILVGLGRARFYLPDNAVPVSLQTFGVLAMGGILGLRWGMFSILAWYFMGMAGVPVFQGGGNGWAYVSGSATAGYLIGFIAATWLVGYLSQHGWNRERGLWPMLLGALVLYVPGLLWLHFRDLGWPAEGELFKAGMYPFIPGDLIKLMGASLVVGGLWTVVDRRARGDRK